MHKVCFFKAFVCFYMHTRAGAAMLGQEIFVTGGQTEKEVINMAEIYNPQLDQWEPITVRMSTPRVGLCTVSMGNMIYVIGKVTLLF